ncbi:MAG: hypothetical protein ACYDDD_10020, partial [Acidithiobacillus ferrivorans]
EQCRTPCRYHVLYHAVAEWAHSPQREGHFIIILRRWSISKCGAACQHILSMGDFSAEMDFLLK